MRHYAFSFLDRFHSGFYILFSHFLDKNPFTRSEPRMFRGLISTLG